MPVIESLSQIILGIPKTDEELVKDVDSSLVKDWKEGLKNPRTLITSFFVFGGIVLVFLAQTSHTLGQENIFTQAMDTFNIFWESMGEIISAIGLIIFVWIIYRYIKIKNKRSS